MTNLRVASEPQAVAGRWRILARQYASGLAKHDPSRDVSISLTQRVVDILVVAGIRGQSWKTIAAPYAERLDELATKILQIRRTVGEQVAASEFELSLVPGGHKFNPSMMDDGEGRAGDVLPPGLTQFVLCTTELGLLRRKKVEMKGKDGHGQWSTVILLKPKVALEAIL